MSNQRTPTTREKVWDLAMTIERVRWTLELIEKDPTISRAVSLDMGLAEVNCRSLSNNLMKMSKRIEP